MCRERVCLFVCQCVFVCVSLFASEEGRPPVGARSHLHALGSDLVAPVGLAILVEGVPPDLTVCVSQLLY